MRIRDRVGIRLLALAFTVGGMAQASGNVRSLDGLAWKSNAAMDTIVLCGDHTVFRAPAWKLGEFIWPSFQCEFPAQDWRGYDRLVLPVFFATPQGKHQFNIRLRDSKHVFRKGPLFGFKPLTPLKGQMLVMTLPPEFGSRKNDLGKVSGIHCYTENPPMDFRILLGKPVLLKPGEAVPRLPEAFRKMEVKARKGPAETLRKAVERLADQVNGSTKEASARKLLKGKLEAIQKKHREGELLDLCLLDQGELPLGMQSLQCLAEVFSQQVPFVSPQGRAVLVGVADSTRKVLPEVPLLEAIPKVLEVDAARNEREALQLVALPFGEGRCRISVKTSGFKGLTDARVDVCPVGFVRTDFVPVYGVSHVGAWPDPLLSFMQEVEVRGGEAQPFWVRVSVGEKQAAGRFQGALTLCVDGEPLTTVPMTVRVRCFALPVASPLPLAVTFWPNLGMMKKCHPEATDAQMKSPEHPVRQWQRHHRAWADLLKGYYLKEDSLYQYGNWEIDFQGFSRLKQEGRLGYFNLGEFYPATEDPKSCHGMQWALDRLRPRFEQTRKLGLLKHAYIYGGDEVTDLKGVQRAVKILKREFPGVPILTTARDKTYGGSGKLADMDWFCPLLPEYHVGRAAEARRQGRQVWWYICNVPTSHFPNNFIESPGVEIRLLMGAMTAKYRPDGFLYYQTSLWNHEFPITQGPYTGWNGESLPDYNGDGNWTYPGPDCKPLATIRLENFRDGLEDFAYVTILEGLLRRAKATGGHETWRRRAELALAVPETLVRSLTDFSRDAKALRLWRRDLAELIEQAPEEEN